MMTIMWEMTGRKGMTGLTRITTYKVDKYDNSTAGDTRRVAAVDDIIGYMMSLFMMDMVVLERTTGMTRKSLMMPSSTKTTTTNL